MLILVRNDKGCTRESEVDRKRLIKLGSLGDECVAAPIDAVVSSRLLRRWTMLVENRDHVSHFPLKLSKVICFGLPFKYPKWTCV